MNNEGVYKNKIVPINEYDSIRGRYFRKCQFKTHDLL